MIFWLGFTVMVLNEGFVIMRHVHPWFARKREALMAKYGSKWKRFHATLDYVWIGGVSLGIMVDISHVSDKAFYESIEISEVPVIASHSSLRHFTPGFERNVSDDMLIKLASKGGVISINFGSSFLTKEALEYRRNREGPYPFADVTDVVDHIDRVVNLVGIDHVGIGSDYDGVGDTLPSNLKDVSTFPCDANEVENIPAIAIATWRIFLIIFIFL